MRLMKSLEHFNFENVEMLWWPSERTPAPEAKAGPRSRRASAVAAGRLTDDDSNESLKTASALKSAQFQRESAPGPVDTTGILFAGKENKPFMKGVYSCLSRCSEAAYG